MNLTDAQTLAEHLIALHMPDMDVLFRWGVQGTNTAYGQAFDNGIWREVRLSPEHTSVRSFEQVRNTLLHEICHLLAGVHTGHGEAFMRWADMLDVKPTTDSAALVVALARRG